MLKNVHEMWLFPLFQLRKSTPETKKRQGLSF